MKKMNSIPAKTITSNNEHLLVLKVFGELTHTFFFTKLFFTTVNAVLLLLTAVPIGDEAGSQLHSQSPQNVSLHTGPLEMLPPAASLHGHSLPKCSSNANTADIPT